MNNFSKYEILLLPKINTMVAGHTEISLKFNKKFSVGFLAFSVLEIVMQSPRWKKTLRVSSSTGCFMIKYLPGNYIPTSATMTLFLGVTNSSLDCI